ncbi:MAG TPA: hypothetical protein VFE37_00815 [Chloroflexota bacterium]|nr:hypothetical protein [Chloroflexota bacterium]
MSAEEREGVAQAEEGAAAPGVASAALDASAAPEPAQASPEPAAPEPPLPAAEAPGQPAVAGTRDGLSAADLLALLAALFPAGTPARHWTASLDSIGPLASGLPADLAGATEGRAWSARAELRWQQAGGGQFSALYLGEGEALPDGFAPLARDLRTRHGEAAAGLYLWGRRDADGRYRSTRLPRPLDYPAAGNAPEVRQPYQLLVGPDGIAYFLRLTLAEEA